mgnify:CR=1 FL=1
MRDFNALAAGGGALVVMNRLANVDGSQIEQEHVAAIEYTVYAVGPSGTLEAVEGHDAEALDVADVIFDDLQTSAPWDTDEDPSGYNFRHTVDVSTADAFPDWGRRYMVVYRVELVSGPPIVWRWIVRTLAVV